MLISDVNIPRSLGYGGQRTFFVAGQVKECSPLELGAPLIMARSCDSIMSMCVSLSTPSKVLPLMRMIEHHDWLGHGIRVYDTWTRHKRRSADCRA